LLIFAQLHFVSNVVLLAWLANGKMRACSLGLLGLGFRVRDKVKVRVRDRVGVRVGDG